MKGILTQLTEMMKGMADPEREEALEELKSLLYEYSPRDHMPVDFIRWVPIEKVTPNDYNPNAVALREMRLLQISILADGYTQPIVTFYDEETDSYVIVDGFHRYYCCKMNEEIRKRTLGRLPIVVIEKSLGDRMASTVRHNRARGSHSVEGMSDLVFQMLEQGMEDKDICNELGMEAEELLKLKHLTGFSKLFEDVEYGPSWEGANQVRTRLDWEKGEAERKETQVAVVDIMSSGKEAVN